MSVEIVCVVCGYPDWWVDNDCAACGGMTIEEATQEVKA